VTSLIGLEIAAVEKTGQEVIRCEQGRNAFFLAFILRSRRSIPSGKPGTDILLGPPVRGEGRFSGPSALAPRTSVLATASTKSGEWRAHRPRKCPPTMPTNELFWESEKR
jgi:hypothetical protein